MRPSPPLGRTEYFCLRTRPHDPEQPQQKKQPQTAPEQRVLCRACRFPVTHETQRMAMAGGHEHTFFNPHGALFHIGCFRQAPGCAAVGLPSAEFSWFAGYLWQIALCDGCRHHLGWRFLHTSDDTSFWGLILARLIAKE